MKYVYREGLGVVPAHEAPDVASDDSRRSPRYAGQQVRVKPTRHFVARSQPFGPGNVHAAKAGATMDAQGRWCFDSQRTVDEYKARASDNDHVSIEEE